MEKTLRHSIETLREKMDHLIEEEGVSSDEVLRVSQELDELIAQFQAEHPFEENTQMRVG